jgi:hypothetical protein
MKNTKYISITLLIIFGLVLNLFGKDYIKKEVVDFIVYFIKPIVTLLLTSIIFPKISDKYYLYFFPLGLFMTGYSKNIFNEKEPYYWIPTIGYSLGFFTILIIIFRLRKKNFDNIL